MLRHVRRLATSATGALPDLVGTAPSHRSYIFLHTPQPPSEYPARYATPLQRALLLRTVKWGGSVNFSWSPEQPAYPIAASGDQAYHLTAFSRNGRLALEGVRMENVEEVAKRLQEHAEGGAIAVKKDEDVHLYVCTHGSRDCRCGDTGGAVVRALQEELKRRNAQDPNGPSSRVKVAETAHVGGHKYAANILVYPHGEWLGYVEPEDVPAVLDAVFKRPTRPASASDPPLCPPHWRGRMGLAKDEQIELFQATAQAA
ncbi:hypothetical protein CONPUDRAFT_112147 [Coniophora puteana RWD-64-598 SS2]|uniref:Sucraseferredoxin-like protein n=1 Tax=Coniophora puteana (strain RWD-64-598) TaxID=741705 RepID=A0A5M3M9X2_CONPW|nr:uncharacterized protein CONPUDRAFT_112147 [Coniophora puteana RWD-64-598 SS2]EIW75590.1 hypothetical protein CONPUDRAFT_112147 [Coniophora puteana RWD-64-598 SS2]